MRLLLPWQRGGGTGVLWALVQAHRLVQPFLTQHPGEGRDLRIQRGIGPSWMGMD